MEKHVTVLGILYLAFSVLGLLLAIIIFTAVVGGGIISGDSEAIAITSIVGPAVALFFVLLSTPGLIGGIYLLKHRPWARILVLILGFINLIEIPIGTALGIYTIWVLFKDETAQLFTPSPAAQTVL
ncbi:MAG: hypothetical protein JRF36_04780 [Deltaproteobacteria bacterium]|jgi:hypothetical protein|nr:hypothetical protein [Deltaproteobacteria bacterium]MBW2469366.1 hypothetical protein [Deltaproteobacteria bacterium]MBW2489438.1 hypothetical protein [Deltaproteobacteria bacterium]MBW2516455.1 hypothetical protein [Deltaproteobacteria bacterium]